MTKARRIGLLALLLSSAFSLVFALILQRTAHPGIVDFKIVYLAAKCLVEHRDPYNQQDYLQTFVNDGGVVPSDEFAKRKFEQAVMAVVYLPTALMLLAPLGALSWAVAQALWTVMMVAVFTLACCLLWDIAADSSPTMAVCLLALVLANTEVLFAYGNAAGLAVALCVIAILCFVRGRFSVAGVLCLAASLAIKPHDSAAVWLFLLIAGGAYRKRALQTAAAFAVLCVPAVLWVGAVSPHWIQEIRSNVELVSARGGIADPGPSGISNGTGGMIISLQSVASLFRDVPAFYNAVAYGMVALLFLLLLVATIRRRMSRAEFWLGMAVLGPLSMLPVYHRPYDAKLLVLAVPACCMLWRRGGARRWAALILTSAALLLTSDIPASALGTWSAKFSANLNGFSHQLVAALLTRPVPLVLLAMSMFYLTVYVPHPEIVTRSETENSRQSTLM